MAQYLLSVWHDAEYEMDFSTPEARRLVGQVGAFNAKLGEAGAWVFGAGLQPASSATVVRPGSGSVSMTDGPYAETKEQMGGGSGSSRPRTSTRPWSGPGKRPPRPRGRWSCAPCRMNDELAALYRREVGRCTATLVRVLGDLDLAEDAVAEAFAIAAERWPVTGIPPNPGGWITTTARVRVPPSVSGDWSRSVRRNSWKSFQCPPRSSPKSPSGGSTVARKSQNAFSR